MSAPPPRKKRNIEENTSEHQSITLLDLVADDNVLGYILQFIGTDAHSLFRLSWTCRFWRTKLANDELWHQLLVDLLDGVNWETCVRLCELSGLDCKSLAAAVVSATQPHSVVHEYTEVKEAVDPRNWGIITFMPQRLDNVNDTALFQQAVVDVCRWCVGITKATGKSGQFLWLGQFGRAELLVSYSQSKLVFGLEGESAYILQDRDAFVQDAIDCIGADCCFLKLDVDAPSQLAWMNGDSRIGDTFDDALERISRADISAVVEAGSGFTLGMLYVTCLGGEECGVNYHFRAASAGSRARKVNPMARYAVHKGYHRERHNVHSILWALAATNIPPNVFGDNLDYPCPSDWIGFPFDLEG